MNILCNACLIVFGLLLLFVTCLIVISNVKKMRIKKDILNYEINNNCMLIFITDISFKGSFFDKLSMNSGYSYIHEHVINIDDSTKFQYFIEKANSNKIKRLDIIIHSNGGSIMPNDIIVSNLYTFNGAVNTYIPYYAHSAASMIAISGTTMYMNNCSVLSPVDPIHCANKKEFSYQALCELYKMKKNSLEEDLLLEYIDGKKTYDDAISVTHSLLKKRVKPKYIPKIIEEFVSGKYPHDKIFSYNHIKNLGLHVVNPIPKDIINITKKMLIALQKIN